MAIIFFFLSFFFWNIFVEDKLVDGANANKGQFCFIVDFGSGFYLEIVESR